MHSRCRRRAAGPGPSAIGGQERQVTPGPSRKLGSGSGLLKDRVSCKSARFMSIGGWREQTAWRGCLPGVGATEGRGHGLGRQDRTRPTFWWATHPLWPPGQEAVSQQRLLGVLDLGAQGQGAEQLRVVGRAAVVQHVRQLQGLHAAPLPEHLPRTAAGSAGSQPHPARPCTPVPPADAPQGGRGWCRKAYKVPRPHQTSRLGPQDWGLGRRIFYFILIF